MDQLKLKPIISQISTANPITLTSELSVKEALQVLASKSILSAPIVDENGVCIGLIDVLDCVSFLLQTYFSNTETPFKNTLLQFSFDVQKVADVMDLSKKNPFVPMLLDDKLTVMDVLKHFANGIHRVPIINEHQKVTNIISQTNMLRFLFEEKNSLLPREYLEKTVEELHLGFWESEEKHLLSVQETAIAMEAFQKISENGVSAVAIYDNKGKQLISSLAAQDLNGFLGEDANLLYLPVLEFQQRCQSKNTENVQERQLFEIAPGVIICKTTDTIATLAQRMKQSKTHRCYIVRDDLKPIGVISLTALFKSIYNFKQ